jgi:hypothetical protein
MVLSSGCRIDMTATNQSSVKYDNLAVITHISAKLADIAKLPKNETIRPQITAVGPPDGKAIDSDVAMAVHEFRIA